METSCKDNYNVSDAFTTLIEMTNNELIKMEEHNLKLNNNSEIQKKRKFC